MHWEQNVSLSTVLACKEGFELFMDFLVAEYSTENLLCYIELTQFLRKWQLVIYKLNALEAAADGDETRADLVTAAMDFVHSHIECEADSDSEVDRQPWSFRDRDAVLLTFEWVKKPAVVTQHGITMHRHLSTLREKYISAASEHQVNIRAALYKNWTRISRMDCELRTLDISNVLLDAEDALELNAAGSSSVKAIASTPCLQPLELQATGTGTGSEREEFAAKSPSASLTEAIRKSHSLVYDRSLNKLEGVAKVLKLVEDTRTELWKNMNDSWRRFRMTRNYVDYIRKVHQKTQAGHAEAL